MKKSAETMALTSKSDFVMRPVLLCILSLSGIATHAQVFMRTFENAASLSLGGAVSAYPGLSAGLSNEALAGFGEKAGVYLGSAIPYGISGWQTAQIQGFAKINDVSGAGLDVTYSGTEAYREQKWSLIYGRRLSDKFFFGGSADLLRVSAQEYGSATGVNVSIGMLANPLPGLWIGVRLRNPVRQSIGPDAPSTILRIGAAWKASNIFLLLAESEKMLERPVQIKAGMEYRPLESLYVRAGVRTGGTARAGFGIGIRFGKGLGLDAGSEWHPSLGITPALMFVWRKP